MEKVRTIKMSYKEQKELWLKKHPKATPEEAYEAGYLSCTTNWCTKEKFRKEKK